MTLSQYLKDKTDFLKCVLLCHDCTKLQPHEDLALKKSKTQKEVLTGASLDEQALLQALEQSKCGEFVERSARTITIKLDHSRELVYDMIRINEFSSKRKLMSVVVRDQTDDRLYVFAKGADS